MHHAPLAQTLNPKFKPTLQENTTDTNLGAEALSNYKLSLVDLHLSNIQLWTYSSQGGVRRGAVRQACPGVLANPTTVHYVNFWTQRAGK